MHGLRVDTQANASQDLKAHGFTHRLAAHTVEVVHKIEKHRQAAAQLRLPKDAVLVHGGKHHRLPNRPAAHGAIPDVGDDDPGLAVHALKQRRPGGDVCRAAHDGVVGHDSKWGEKSMHRTPHPFVEPRLTTKNLC